MKHSQQSINVSGITLGGKVLNALILESLRT